MTDKKEDFDPKENTSVFFESKSCSSSEESFVCCMINNNVIKLSAEDVIFRWFSKHICFSCLETKSKGSNSETRSLH